MRIVTTPYRELPAATRTHLEAIAEAEFGAHPLLGKTTWAEPDWSFQAFEGERLAAFHNIILRTVRVDGAPVNIAGLNNVVTLASFRRRGIASRMLRETQPRWFSEFGVQRGMLLCAETLIGFYASLRWKLVKGPVLYQQPDGRHEWPAQCMVLDAADTSDTPGCVDLCGLPW